MTATETLEKSVSKTIVENIPIWRCKYGLHPTTPPNDPADNRFIRCDNLSIPEQLDLCEKRILQQQNRINDLLMNCKATDSRAKAIESAQQAIAQEFQFKEQLNKMKTATKVFARSYPDVYPNGSGSLSYDQSKNRWLYTYKMQVWDESKKTYVWRSRTKHVAKHLLDGVQEARAQGKTVVEILRLI